MTDGGEYRSRQRYQEACYIIEALEDEGFESRLAGGCVRDRILNLAPKDYDIATQAIPPKVCSIFRQKGYKVVPTGIKHGTVTIVGKFGTFETTTLRRDIETDGRHAEVEFGSSFEEDAARRDFTFNAMTEDRHGKVFDYFLGRKHLEEKQLHFVGDARKRITEDYLRILRMYRFWARFGCSPNSETLKTVEELGAGLAKISQERITSELKETLAAVDPWEALKHLFDSQISMIFLPDGHLPSKDDFFAMGMIPNLSLARLALLIETVSDINHLKAICSRLKLSNRESNILTLMVFGFANLSKNSTQSQIMSFIDRSESIEEGLFLSTIVPVWSIIAREKKDFVHKAKLIEETKQHLRKAALPISSKDLMSELRMEPGSELGYCLSLLKQAFRDEKWTDRKAGLEWLVRHRRKQ